LKLKVSLVEFKQKMGGEEGLLAVLHMIRAQPVCTSEEWSRIVSWIQTAQFQDVPFCCPTEDILVAAEPYLRQALQDAVTAIPNEIYLDNRSATASNLPLGR